MEHRRNSTGLIFRRFAIFYRIFLAILLIFDACFARYPACPAFRTIISSKLCATCSARFYRSIAFSFLSCWPAAMFSIAASRSAIPDHKMIFGNFICTSVRSSAFRKGYTNQSFCSHFCPPTYRQLCFAKLLLFCLVLFASFFACSQIQPKRI